MTLPLLFLISNFYKREIKFFAILVVSVNIINNILRFYLYQRINLNLASLFRAWHTPIFTIINGAF